MVTLPILSTIFLSLVLIVALLSNQIRGVIFVTYTIVTTWLCYAMPLETASMVCAIIAAVFHIVNWIIMSQKSIISGNDVASIDIFVFLFINACIWLPWSLG